MQTAKEIYIEYQKKAQHHVNYYCQLVDVKPFNDFSEQKRFTEKIICLAWLWKNIAEKLASYKYYQEG